MESKKLKKGYTTGVHALFALQNALDCFLVTKQLSISKTNKMDNDDLDVTKGCEIVACVSDDLEDLELNEIEHKPYILENLTLYAGKGVGVITKKGLKPPKGYPAINPTPLKEMKRVAKNLKTPLFATISVTNGEEIAKNTANAKVGVLGGISILGSSGFVKPISNEAYLDSIRAEVEFIKANGYKKVIFTLGATSLKEAKKTYKNEQIVEIGNFIYEGLKLAKDLDIVLYIGVAKALKITQGFKNTHNRFGSIDFKELGEWLGIDLKDMVSVKRVCEIYDEKELKKMIKQRAKKRLKEWLKSDVEVVIC